MSQSSVSGVESPSSVRPALQQAFEAVDRHREITADEVELASTGNDWYQLGLRMGRFHIFLNVGYKPLDPSAQVFRPSAAEIDVKAVAAFLRGYRGTFFRRGIHMPPLPKLTVLPLVRAKALLAAPPC